VCESALNSRPEIVAFGANTEVQGYDLYGVRIFKLSHAEKEAGEK
jgi:hypothetical protein